MRCTILEQRKAAGHECAGHLDIKMTMLYTYVVQSRTNRERVRSLDG